MKNRRDLCILVGLFLGLILFVVLGPGRQRSTPVSNEPSTHLSGDRGALALYNWFDRLGYDVQRLEYREFWLDQDTDMLVILSPSEAITSVEAEQTLQWVEDGGTLLLADDSAIVWSNSMELFDALGVHVEVLTDTATIERAEVSQPVFDQPPLTAPTVRTERRLLPRGNDYVKLLGTEDSTVLLGMKYGSGYVYLSSATYPFTNQGLREENNAVLALNLLRRVPPGGRIMFDEIHHGYVTPPSTTKTMLGSPWGWAALYAVLALVLYLILSGRRFGRPIPLREEIARRSSAEYVESMADLFQRGGKRAYIGQHYYQSFKRRLARPYGVNPKLDDEAFVYDLSRVREIDSAALSAMLTRLRTAPANERELVQTVDASEAMLAELLGGDRGRPTASQVASGSS